MDQELQSNAMENNKRIAKNTLMLYARMFFTMGITLYSCRLVLNALGQVDFGIYNVVGGIVAMFGFLNSSMTASTQRFITFELGKNDKTAVRKVFSLSIQTHVIISLLFLLLTETLGLWFIYNKLVIPADKLEAAIWVYQCAVISAVVLIMSVPYNALIVAYEKMTAFAYISIVDVLFKFAIALFLSYSLYDRLKVYAVLLLAVQCSIRLLYGIYCKRHFEESVYIHVKDKNSLKKLFSFAAWSLIGNFAGISFIQGVNILLNLFFGPVINAARGISGQVVGALNQFAINFQMAINPQITKSYATGDLEYLRELIYNSSRYTGYLLLFLCLPICLEIDFILHVWLGDNVPDYTGSFIILSIVCTTLDSMSNSIMVASNATGNIKKFVTIISTCLLSILPIGYLTLFLGGDPNSIMIVCIIVALIAFILRLIIIRPKIKLEIIDFLIKTLGNVFVVSMLSLVAPIVLKCILQHTPLIAVLIIVVGFLSALVCIYCIGINSEERTFINKLMAKYISKIFHII